MAERKPDNRWRRVIGGGVITCLVVALLALMTWAQRTRWRTYTFPPDPKTGLAVAIEYPDDWALDSRVSQQSAGDLVAFRPLEPHSILKWCREHLFAHRMARELPTTFHFSVHPPFYGTIDDLQAAMSVSAPTAGGPINGENVIRRSLSAGSALDRTMHLIIPMSGGRQLRWKSRLFLIYFKSPNRAERQIRPTLTINCSMPEDGSSGLDARLLEALGRVHFTTVPVKRQVGRRHNDSPD